MADPAQYLRQQDKDTKNRIAASLAQLNAVWQGKPVGTDPIKAFDLSKAGSYYLPSGDPFKFDPGDTGFLNYLNQNPGLRLLRADQFAHDPKGDVSSILGTPAFVPSYGNLTVPKGDLKVTPLQLAEWSRYGKYLASTGQLFGGLSKGGQAFDENFFNQRTTDYENFALPQLAQQTEQASNALMGNLASRGMINSTEGQRLLGLLQQETAKQQRGIADVGIAQANQLRADTENQYNVLVDLAQRASDPGTVGAGAIKAAATINAPSTFQPLNNLFGNFSNLYLANTINPAQQTAPTMGGNYNWYNMFGPNYGMNVPSAVSGGGYSISQ